MKNYDILYPDWEIKFVFSGKYGVIRKGKFQLVNKVHIWEQYQRHYDAYRKINGKWTKLE